MGHEDVIHAGLYNKDCPTLLTSTSVKFSAQVWEEEVEEEKPQSVTSRTKSNNKGGWDLKWTSWGHTACGWDVQFYIKVIHNTELVQTILNRNVSTYK